MTSIARRPSLVHTLKPPTPSLRPFGFDINPEADARELASKGLASLVPDFTGRGLSESEARFVADAYRAARDRAKLIAPEDMVFRCQCGGTAEDVALRVVLSRRPRAVAPAFSAWPPDSDTAFWDARTAFDEACEAAIANAATPVEAYDAVRALPPISGGSPAACELPTRKATRVKNRPFEPSIEDRAWWAAECDRAEQESIKRQYEASREMDAVERGLVEFTLHDGRPDDSDMLIVGACG